MNLFEQYIEENFSNMLEDLLSLTSIPSIKATDNSGFIFGEKIHDALNMFEELCQKLELSNYHREDDYYAWVEVGDSQLDLIGLICHIDVVDFDATKWRYNPLGEMSEGIIYGRGVSDNKGPLIMSLYVLKFIQEQKIPLRVRLIVGADEESDFTCMKQYHSNQEEMPDYGIVPDAKFPLILAEKSIWNFTVKLSDEQFGVKNISSISSGISNNSIPDAAKIKIGNQIYDYEGKTAHAANYKQGDNALLKLFGQLSTMNLIKTDSILDKLSCHIGDQCIQIPYNVYLVDLVPTVIRKSDGIQLTIDMRVDNSLDIFHLKNYMMQFLDIKNTDIIRENIAQGYHYSEDLPLITHLIKHYQQAMDRYRPLEKQGTPLEIAGTTYAKYFPNCITYGPGFINEHSYGHRADERITVDSFKLATYIYLSAIIDLVDFNYNLHP